MMQRYVDNGYFAELKRQGRSLRWLATTIGHPYNTVWSYRQGGRIKTMPVQFVIAACMAVGVLPLDFFTPVVSQNGDEMVE